MAARPERPSLLKTRTRTRKDEAKDAGRGGWTTEKELSAPLPHCIKSGRAIVALGAVRQGRNCSTWLGDDGGVGPNSQGQTGGIGTFVTKLDHHDGFRQDGGNFPLSMHLCLQNDIDRIGIIIYNSVMVLRFVVQVSAWPLRCSGG